MQTELDAAKEQLAAGASAEELARMTEVESALQRAVKDYEILLRELTSLKAEAMHKDAAIARLERGLTAANAQAKNHQCAPAPGSAPHGRAVRVPRRGLTAAACVKSDPAVCRFVCLTGAACVQAGEVRSGGRLDGTGGQARRRGVPP